MKQHGWVCLIVASIVSGLLSGRAAADDNPTNSTGSPGDAPLSAGSSQPTDRIGGKSWALTKLVQPELPSVAGAHRGQTPIDMFVLAKLASRKAELSFSPVAPPPTLVRRVWLDLVGLPPPLADVDAYCQDTRPTRYVRLIDRLLASPHFGERWGQHWLDVVGYVDTVGYDFEPYNIIKPDGKWRYRHYVIRSLNSDKPYDQFITEQLAGDELVNWRDAEQYTNKVREHLIATGYWRTAKDFTTEDVGNIPSNYYGVLHDTVEILGSTFLGMTLQCARCHDHKFDPISQVDYYRVMALITTAYNPQAWMPVYPYKDHTERKFKLPDRALLDVSEHEKKDIDQQNARTDDRVGQLKNQLDDVHARYREKLFQERLAAVPDTVRAAVKTAWETPEKERDDEQRQLVKDYEDVLQVTSDEVTAALSPTDKAASQRTRDEMAQMNNARRSYGRIQALFDVGSPPPTFLLMRGNYETPGQQVEPGFLAVLADANSDRYFTRPADDAGTHTSGRRTALARWFTDADSPASGPVARVMVNRLWQHLFGEGIVTTPGNFGAHGAPPTHPELLDWLAGELMNNEWRIKPLIRQMMTSRVYRQASSRLGNEDGTTQHSALGTPQLADPGNTLLWHMRLRRLESEVIRDSILAVSGRLNTAMDGPPVPVRAAADGSVTVRREELRHPSEEYRRSIYLLARRNFQLSTLTVFDRPSVSTGCQQRETSAVPLQSLMMLNDGFNLQQAELLAKRVSRVGGLSHPEQIERAFRLVLTRKPNESERRVLLDLHQRQSETLAVDGVPAPDVPRRALVHVCHALMNTSEFLYVE